MSRRVDRRIAPRPLPAHLLGAIALWQTSRAALPNLNSVLPRSSPSGDRAPSARLRRLAGEIATLGPEAVATALDSEIARRARAYADGLERYRRHDYRRTARPVPVLWRRGTTRLLDYGAAGTGPAVLVVPSLINRYAIVDLLPGRSFVAFLAGCDMRPLVVDWGAPGAAERHFTLTDYVVRRLEPMLAAARITTGRPVGVVGYCMGGLLALALALRQRPEIACLALLATPWDFHADRAAAARLLGRLAGLLRTAPNPLRHDSAAPFPVEAIQALFFALDPFLAERKFAALAAADPTGAGIRDFVALEDWINDGVPLAWPAAEECLGAWYGDNAPARRRWQVAGRVVDPAGWDRPALVVLPRRDRIVPPASAAALAAALPDATALPLPLGHIGMMASATAPAVAWAPIAEWLRARLAG